MLPRQAKLVTPQVRLTSIYCLLCTLLCHNVKQLLQKPSREKGTRGCLDFKVPVHIKGQVLGALNWRFHILMGSHILMELLLESDSVIDHLK
jgi:hypothetical protein